MGNDRGFTLFEVLVALFIFSVAVLALIATRNQSIRMNEAAREHITMTLLAHRKLAEAMGEGFVPLGQAAGSFGDAHKGYRWKESVIPSPLPVVRQVTVTIIRGTGRHRHSISLTALISSLP